MAYWQFKMNLALKTNKKPQKYKLVHLHVMMLNFNNKGSPFIFHTDGIFKTINSRDVRN